jgi:AcrR family transcriptional regulator
MVRSAAALIGKRGVNATSFSDVVEDSGSPRGSIYHHFPAGKAQLTEDAVRWTSERLIAHMRAGTERTPRAVMERFFGMWRGVVVASGGSAGCVVAGVAVDTEGDGALISLVRTTFRSWVAVLAERLESAGMKKARATTLATTALAAMEGALILCRAEGGPGPIDTVAAEILGLVKTRR